MLNAKECTEWDDPIKWVTAYEFYYIVVLPSIHTMIYMSVAESFTILTTSKFRSLKWVVTIKIFIFYFLISTDFVTVSVNKINICMYCAFYHFTTKIKRLLNYNIQNKL